MKPLIIILAVVAVLQAATLGYGLVSDDSEARPSDKALEEGAYEPSFVGLGLLNDVTSFFAKSPTISKNSMVLQKGQSKTVSYSDGADEQAIRFEVEGGYGVRIEYSCFARNDQDTCPQVMCLCAAGAALDLDVFTDCGKVYPRETQCLDQRAKGRVIINNGSGHITIKALGDRKTSLNIY